MLVLLGFVFGLLLSLPSVSGTSLNDDLRHDGVTTTENSSDEKDAEFQLHIVTLESDSFSNLSFVYSTNDSATSADNENNILEDVDELNSITQSDFVHYDLNDTNGNTTTWATKNFEDAGADIPSIGLIFCLFGILLCLLLLILSVLIEVQKCYESHSHNPKGIEAQDQGCQDKDSESQRTEDSSFIPVPGQSCRFQNLTRDEHESSAQTHTPKLVKITLYNLE